MAIRFHRDDVKVKEKTPLYQGFLSVYRYSLQHRLFSGDWSPVIDRELMERGHAVVVIPYDPVTDELVVVEQFRVGALEDENGPWLFEFVAGMFDADESAEEVATRELEEEAGLTAKRLIYATSYYSSPGGTDEKLTIYIAEVDSKSAADFGGLPEEDEDIRVHVIPRDKVIAMLEREEINNAASVIGLQWLQLHHDKVFSDLE
ncbi:MULTISPECIES: NUDIX domain-containing protein [Idiomarina]|jgi:ADP-ribose pyrophosphatase|uniref:ADP-ribose pyrophosphatase n=1 Tax=Idiomarina abyssalis TaxID=86102 RepID=A0A8I1KFK1_9GAMM|nr:MULTISPECIES: NUDIX domain-containing protein [Idiomarina]RDX34949.1 NUDIX domain-containing protein [Idiomarina sp. HD9-110m-PIT-SAG05]MAB21271.1 ADP-ribose diphosphatase [Idiomarina sp.]MBE91824.1 ADP-ribose diphosphatase [Idiomarina sp.]MBH93915.1 ADP-ribose diphosphatase [Idiomarina sp.]MBJ7267779.1 NUDIX domain-containing protein [Idiomarina abyssalis]|tara:strand:+ start:29283 stop:29894 length:612 start_codon:yes stop_codon:yes gene_type:complete